MNDPRGSVWRKWDLHVHTPASFHWNDGVNLSNQTPESRDRVLEQLIETVEASDVAVFGIMDYWTFDGYLALRDSIISRDITLQKTIFPGMELRIEAAVDYRLNIQVVLSDSLKKQQLQDFKAALRIRMGTTDRSLSDEALIAFARTLDVSKAKIHGFNEADLMQEDKLLQLGSMTAVITRESLSDAIKQIPQNTCFVIMPYDTSDGLSELDWEKHPHDDNYFMQSAQIFETRDPENVDLFLGRETPKNCNFLENFLKTMGGKPKPAISGSDAHKIADYGVFPSNRITWIKADPTFEGLRQVVTEPCDRSFIGLLPPKLAQVQKNKTKFINTISLQRKVNATLAETWFNNTIPLNPDLVAIIGNKGKGKSALVDSIGLLCNTKQDNNILTFLSKKNFRHPKDNKARHFEATLTWESGTAVTKGLDDNVDEHQPELVKYIPQNFLEKICTELGKIDESDFDRELKKVIFSHVQISEQLGKASLDELIVFKTSEASAKIRILKQELLAINEELVTLEDRSMPEHRQEIENLLKVKQTELEVHEKSKPEEVAKPDNNPTKQNDIAEVAVAIEDAQKHLTECEKQILEATQEQNNLAQLIATADKLLARIDNLQYQLLVFSTESKEDFVKLGIQATSVLQINLDRNPVVEKQVELSGQKSTLDDNLNPEKAESLIQVKQKIVLSIEQLKVKLDEPNKNFQIYQAALLEWENKKQEITGSVGVVGSVKYYEDQLSLLDAVPKQLIERRGCRLSKTKEIHNIILQLAETYRKLYAPVNQFIEKSPLAKEKFQLNFEVSIVDSGFQEAFFEIISQGATGTFYGVEQGCKMLKNFLDNYDFDTEEGIDAFLTEMIDALETDKRSGDKSVRVSDQLKKGKTKLMLYDMMFSLDYLKPRYALRMGDKELHQLSPGERGTLLLVFYLLVDKDDIPLVIDQPEENLDNQTVYELLVPCIKEAKQRRQIVIVTHNPNLAVVCDAEQIIFADLDKKNNYQMNYLSGAIENPKINRAIVDVLEGTMPAFENRDLKYMPL